MSIFLRFTPTNEFYYFHKPTLTTESQLIIFTKNILDIQYFNFDLNSSSIKNR